MKKNDFAGAIAELLNRSRADVTSRLDKLDADAVINLKVAVDDQDADLAGSILDQQEPTPMEDLDARESLREINRIGKQSLQQQQPLDRVWELIGHVKPQDWRMIWPAVNQDVIIALYNEISDSDSDSVSAEQSDEIFDYARQFVSEHVIYQNQLVEVAVPRGPNSTVGIKLNGQTVMVKRAQISMLDEHVLGMTAMPSLTRMRQLAGLAHMPSHTAPAHEQFTETEAASAVMDLLHQLQQQVADIAKAIQEDNNMEQAVIHCAGAKLKLNRLMQAVESAAT